PHVLAATAHHDDAVPIAADNTSWLLDRAATYQQTNGEPASARPLLERALRIRDLVYGPHHPYVATTLTNLAWALNELGDPAGARRLHEQALHIREAAYGLDHPEVAISLTNLGRVLNELGEPGSARPLLERALHIREVAYGPNYPEIATTLG